MVVAADDVADAHVPVVDDDAEVVGRRAVRAGDDEVVQLGVAEFDAALDLVVPADDAVGRAAEADHRLHAGRRLGQRLARLGAPAAVVLRLLAAFALRLAHGIELFRRRVAAVRLAVGEHLRHDLLVTVHALHLVERALVVAEFKPVHRLQDAVDRFLRGTRDVGILDAQDELASVAAGVGPREEGGAGAADMQETGGRGSETGADHGQGDWLGERGAFYPQSR